MENYQQLDNEQKVNLEKLSREKINLYRELKCADINEIIAPPKIIKKSFIDRIKNWFKLKI